MEVIKSSSVDIRNELLTQPSGLVLSELIQSQHRSLRMTAATLNLVFEAK